MPNHDETPASLDALGAAGAFDQIDPADRAAADRFDLEMAEDLAQFDAALVEREGPDALTSDRAVRLSQLRQQQDALRAADLDAAEGDAKRVGFVLAAFRRRRGWDRPQLADWLNLDTVGLGRLAAELWGQETGRGRSRSLLDLADRYGAHPERLAEACRRGDR